MDNIETYRGKRVFLRTGDGPWSDFFDDLGQQPDLLKEFERKLGEIGADIVENVVHPTLERFSGALGEAGIENDYALVPGATHEWSLWRDNLAEDLPGMMRALTA